MRDIRFLIWDMPDESRIPEIGSFGLMRRWRLKDLCFTLLSTESKAEGMDARNLFWGRKVGAEDDRFSNAPKENDIQDKS